MASINLGRVGFVLRGIWTSSAYYDPLDVVLYNGNSYVAKATNNSQSPTLSTYWQPLTEIGNAVSSSIAGAAVRYDESQSLNSAQQQTARDNINAVSLEYAQTIVSRLNDVERVANLGLAKANDLIPRVTTLESTVGTLEGTVTTLSGSLDTAVNDISSLKTRMQTAEGKISTNETAIAGLTTRMGTAEGYITDLRGRMADAESGITSLTSRMGTAEGNISSLTGRMGIAETEIANIKADIAYTPVDISSFTINPTQAEMGSTVTSVTYSFAINKVPNTLKLDGASITPASSGTATLSVSLTANKTFSLQATDNGSPSHAAATSTKSATLSFLNNVYYGVAAIPSAVNSAFVTGLTTKVLASTRARSITLNVTSGKYAWYASPTRLGACTFKVGGFDGGFQPAQTVSVTNSSGYSENYYVYRSTNANLGSTTIVIS